MNILNCNFPLKQSNTFHSSDINTNNHFVKHISPIGYKPTTPESPNYDLPQQIQSLFSATKTQKQQNRPLASKSLFSDQQCNIQANIKQQKVDQYSSKVNDDSAETMRKKITSIYDKILESSHYQKKTVKESIIEATFKPAELKKQLQAYPNQNLRNLVREKTTKYPLSSQKKSKSKNKTSFLNDSNAPKTKYQRILEDHFKMNRSKSVKQIEPSRQEIRIANIFGKDSRVISESRRLKQRHESLKNLSKNKFSSEEGVKIEKTKNKSSKYPTKMTEGSEKVTQNDSWMSLDFHQRQRKILQNRKNNEKNGKRESKQKQMKGCTFKPAVNGNFRKNLEQSNEEKKTYIQIYYDKLKKKF